MSIPVLPPPSAKAVEIGDRVKAFLEEHIIPAEHTYHQQLDESGAAMRGTFSVGDLTGEFTGEKQ